jgi:RNA polymerase sigma-70 factor, ECF subfamily
MLITLTFIMVPRTTMGRLSFVTVLTRFVTLRTAAPSLRRADKTCDDAHRDWLADQFEANRPHLRAVAYRMLGLTSEAEDAVQEAWLRPSRTDPTGVQNLGGWLTTVVARVCLDMLRSRESRREELVGEQMPEPIVGREDQADPEHQAVLADSVGMALLVVLERLGPDERLAFVLHELFGVSFDEIARIVGRNPAAARQLASRARRRVHGATPPGAVEVTRQRQIVEAFMAASREGNLQGLLSLLDPDVVLRADATVVRRPRAGAVPEVFGAPEVAAALSGARGTLARLDGVPGAVYLAGGRPLGAFSFKIVGDKIVAIEMVGDPSRLEQLEVVVLND